MPFIDIQPGGEKYLGFAQAKLRQMKAWMKMSGLHVFSKHFWVNATDKIWIKAQDSGNDTWLDWIRIEAGGWDFYSRDILQFVDYKLYAVGKAGEKLVSFPGAVGGSLLTGTDSRSLGASFLVRRDGSRADGISKWKAVLQDTTVVDVGENGLPLSNRILARASASKVGGIAFDGDEGPDDAVVFSGKKVFSFAEPPDPGASPFTTATATKHYAIWEKGDTTIVAGAEEGVVYLDTIPDTELGFAINVDEAGISGAMFTASTKDVFFGLRNPFTFSLEIRSVNQGLIYSEAAGQPLANGVWGFRASATDLFVLGQSWDEVSVDASGNLLITVTLHRFALQEDGSYVHTTASTTVTNGDGNVFVPVLRLALSAESAHVFLRREEIVDPDLPESNVVATIFSESGFTMEVDRGPTSPDTVISTLAGALHAVALHDRAAFYTTGPVDGLGFKSIVKVVFSDGEIATWAMPAGAAAGITAIAGSRDHAYAYVFSDLGQRLFGTDGSAVDPIAAVAAEHPGETLFFGGLFEKKEDMLAICATINLAEEIGHIVHVSKSGEVFTYGSTTGLTSVTVPPPSTILRSQQLEAWA